MTYSVVLSGSESLLYLWTLGLPIFRESKAIGSSDGSKTTFAAALKLVQDDCRVGPGIVVVIHAPTIDAGAKARANSVAARRKGIVWRIERVEQDY
jgi:hypothetical protein